MTTFVIPCTIQAPGALWDIWYNLPDWIRGIYYKLASEILWNPYFYVLLTSVLILERLIPAKKAQKIFSVGLFQDAVWVIMDAVFRVTLLGFYVALLASLYHSHLSFLTIESVTQWPFAVRITMSILVADFLMWLHHVIRHKVPLFWIFHSIHHSQQDVNLFTNFRYHPVEYFIIQTITFIPFFMLALTFPETLFYSLFVVWYTNFYHANLRTNLGCFRYILVTPQSHRIHHSIEPRHLDSNFGVLFSVWDRVFRTQHEDPDEYPDTGVLDPNFPHETTVSALGLLASTWAQLMYPFYGRSGQSDRRLSPLHGRHGQR